MTGSNIAIEAFMLQSRLAAGSTSLRARAFDQNHATRNYPADRSPHGWPNHRLRTSSHTTSSSCGENEGTAMAGVSASLRTNVPRMRHSSPEGPSMPHKFECELCRLLPIACLLISGSNSAPGCWRTIPTLLQCRTGRRRSPSRPNPRSSPRDRLDHFVCGKTAQAARCNRAPACGTRSTRAAPCSPRSDIACGPPRSRQPGPDARPVRRVRISEGGLRRGSARMVPRHAGRRAVTRFHWRRTSDAICRSPTSGSAASQASPDRPAGGPERFAGCRALCLPLQPRPRATGIATVDSLLCSPATSACFRSMPLEARLLSARSHQARPDHGRPGLRTIDPAVLAIS